MSRRALIFDVLGLGVWIVLLFLELVFIQDMFFAVISVIGVFVFAALLGRDARRARGASA
jgi:FtsH-binding integral membrane protein